MVAGPSPNSGAPKGGTEYRKIQELASGGMGSVELARAVGGSHSGEVVAIKRLHPHLEREKHFADMFFDEAWITAGLNHPNVVEIFDWGTDSIGRYLALEFVPGDTLLTLIRDAKKRNMPIPLDLALYIIGKTAEGLHAAHELRGEDGALRHLVHRDVTPSNVMLGVHGEVKLIDFGVAKARDKLSHTSTGTIKGKFGYMSPEQARGFPIDRRSDVFSLGVVLWETLALKRLYRSDSELEILRMIVDDPPTPITTVRPDVPLEIENLIAGALAKSRDDRLGSCGEFAEFIWAMYHERGFTAAEPELSKFFREVMPERCAAIEQLLSGEHEFIEPTVARPASGSFSGVGPRVVSGAVAMNRASPAVTAPPMSGMTSGYPDTMGPSGPTMMAAQGQPSDGSLMAASYTAPSYGPTRSRAPLFAVLGAIGVVAVAGLGWMLGHARGSNATSLPVTTAAATATIPAAIPVDTTPRPLAGTPTVAAVAPAGPAVAAPILQGAHGAVDHASPGARNAHRVSNNAVPAPPMPSAASVMLLPTPAGAGTPAAIHEAPRETPAATPRIETHPSGATTRPANPPGNTGTGNGGPVQLGRTFE
ncbi:MAG: serine/threonine-protein kinase [Deltaproteobacteria bacterium]